MAQYLPELFENLRLIQKIHEVDPLTCPWCQGRMRILAFIDQPEIIKKILKHFGL